MLNWIRKKQSKPYVMLGIDIQEHVIHLLELTEQQITQQIVLPLSADSTPAMVLQKAVVEKQLHNKPAVIALPDHIVIKKVVQIENNLSKREQEAQILFEAEQNIAYTPENFALDFHVIGRNAEHDGLFDVLLIAAPHAEVDKRVEIITSSGLCAHAVDIESNALERTKLIKNINDNWLLSYGLALYGALHVN